MSSPSPIFFAKPSNDPTLLTIQPRLASWNAADHVDQVRLAESVSAAHLSIERPVERTQGSLALLLDVGLPGMTELLNEHDLDNYLCPLIGKFPLITRSRIVSARCTKSKSDSSFIRVDTARPTRSPSRSLDYSAELRTTASSSSSEFKQQISEQLGEDIELEDGPVKLEIAFVVGPSRNWINLWKPTIDALDRLLGRTRPDREWHPRDGRITELGLHRVIDNEIDKDVVLSIRARSCPDGN